MNTRLWLWLLDAMEPVGTEKLTRRSAMRMRVLIVAALATASASALVASTGGAAAAAPAATVVVRGNGQTSPATIASDVAAAGGTLIHPLAILDGGIASVPAGAVATLRTEPGIAAVTPDTTLTLDSIGAYDPTTDVGSLYSTEQIAGVQPAWQQGATGKGIGVALIDTGVAPVQGLAGQGQVWNGPDLSFDSQTAALTQLDEYGHGTHMAGIIAGNDSYGTGTTYAGNANQFTGVAPDAHIVNLKVGDENGVVDVSQVLAAIDWVVQHRNDPGVNIRVLNLSFGTNSAQAYTLDPLAYAAEVAWRNGIVVVAAAGNAGASANGLEDPAMDPFVIAVGAADTQATLTSADDTVASFSSSGNGTRNPDLVAPGVHIASLRDPGSVLDQEYGATATVSSNTRFFRGSGTSQATAVVSGATADFLSAHPGYTPDQVKYALTTSATRLANQPSTLAGAGELNLNAALTANLPPGQVKQTYPQSNGTGTLEAARGSLHVTSSGVTLSGEKDIFGNAFNSATMAQAEASCASWNGGTWNGASWAGASWAGTSWAGASWAGSSWAGTSWAGASWAGATWNGASWGGASWGGSSWAGASWAGASWAGESWGGASWGGASWGGASWSAASWA